MGRDGHEGQLGLLSLVCNGPYLKSELGFITKRNTCMVREHHIAVLSDQSCKYFSITNPFFFRHEFLMLLLLGCIMLDPIIPSIYFFFLM